MCAVIPDYSKTEDDIICTGMVDLLTNAEEMSIRSSIYEVLVARLPDLQCNDFYFVKVKGEKISTPVFKQGQEIGYTQLTSLARQGAVYVILLL